VTVFNIFVDGKVSRAASRKTANEAALDSINLKEHDEQVEFINWCHSQPIKELHLIFAIPNGARTHMGTAKKLVAEGLKRGTPDLFLPVAKGEYHGLFIEMKRRKGGSLSVFQKKMLLELNYQGYCCVVPQGYHEAIRSIVSYLMLPKPVCP
jgi:hypothetical protein